MSTIKRSKTDAFSVKESVNIVKLAEAAFEQISLDQLTDVVVETPTDGDILVYSSDLMAWENVPQAGLNYDLEDLDNITITSVSDGQVITYDSVTSKWVNETPVTGVTTLDGLSDVVITTASTGQVLKYNGTNWVNATDGSTPAGSDTYVQFNDGGSLGADAQFTYNKTTDTLSVPKVNATDGLYTLSASALGWGSARVYDNSDEMGVILDATDNLGADFRGFRFDTGMSAPQFHDGTSWRDMYHEGNLTSTVISYDNTTSGLTATNVKDAIDEVAASSSGGSAPASGYHDGPLLYKSGSRFIPGKLSDNQVAATAQAGDRVHLIPFVARRNMTILDGAVYATSGAGIGQGFSIGIYDNTTDANEDIPGTLLTSASGTLAANANILTLSATLTAGSVYWVGFVMTGNTSLYTVTLWDQFPVFGTKSTTWAATDTYAYIASTSTLPSTVSKASMVYAGASRPCVWLGWEPA